MTRRACLVCGRGFEVTGPRQSRCPDHQVPAVPRHRQYRKLRDRLITAHPYCHLCGQPFDDPADPPVLDHVQPRARGGSHDESNLLPAHRSCNGRKGAGIRW
jgi:5-methylcytosine-specific restriction endonuclease McrA